MSEPLLMEKCAEFTKSVSAKRWSSAIEIAPR
jgi:hypothetical protein